MQTAGWAAYLACSWTWCIGMFLPVLLLRDFGWWGYMAFAVPNVLGAAGMGWVLRRPGASAAITRRHRSATATFSLVTQAFQVFFLFWLILGIDNPLVEKVAWGFGMFGLLVLPALMAERRATLWISIAVWLVSVACAALFLIGEGGPRTPAAAPRLPSSDVLWLAPVCAFGFALCPYLDRTFHRSRQDAPGPSGTAAFTLGFGVLFLALIAFTPLYAGALDPAHPSGLGLATRSTGAALALVAYLALQLGFTFAAHHRELEPAPPLLTPAPAIIRNVATVAGGMAAAFAAKDLPSHAGLSAGEVMYRVFMAFYGLVFPAYVWLCMIPTRDGRSGPTRDRILVFAFAVGVAAPMFWMGFVERHTFWLAPGLLVVLLARLALPRTMTDQHP
jgi:hypothetical protein